MATAYAPAPAFRTSYTVKRRSRAGEHEGDMEGTTHAASGALAGAGVGLLLSAAAGRAHVPAADAVARDLLFALVTAGTALLPDADHPQASFARAAGWLSHGLSHLTAVLSGGHRQGMHSLAGIAAVALAVNSAAVWWPNRWALGFLAGLLAIAIAAGLSAAGFARRGLSALLCGAAVAGLAVALARGDLWWLTALGMGLHVLEDEFTGHGCALLWPFTRRRFGGDGRQPGPARSARRPASRAPRARAPFPVRPGPGVRLSWDLGGLCGACLTRDHGGCEDRGCACSRGRHPSRPGEPASRGAPPLPDAPPF